MSEQVSRLLREFQDLPAADKEAFIEEILVQSPIDSESSTDEYLNDAGENPLRPLDHLLIPGDLVHHVEYGYGKVTGVGSVFAEVLFSSGIQFQRPQTRCLEFQGTVDRAEIQSAASIPINTPGIPKKGDFLDHKLFGIGRVVSKRGAQVRVEFGEIVVAAKWSSLEVATVELFDASVTEIEEDIKRASAGPPRLTLLTAALRRENGPIACAAFGAEGPSPGSRNTFAKTSSIGEASFFEEQHLQSEAGQGTLPTADPRAIRSESRVEMVHVFRCRSCGSIVPHSQVDQHLRTCGKYKQQRQAFRKAGRKTGRVRCPYCPNKVRLDRLAEHLSRVHPPPPLREAITCNFCNAVVSDADWHQHRATHVVRLAEERRHLTRKLTSSKGRFVQGGLCSPR